MNQSPQKSALGKGLASLLPGAVPPPAGEPTLSVDSRERHLGISMVGVDEIQANPYQPRRDFDERALVELADSIRQSGIVQPLVVRRQANGYALIAGERRLRAAKLAGLKQVPIVIRRSTDREALELALVENIQREDLNCVDEARAYFQLQQEFGLTQEQLAERVGKERATVANGLRLLRLSPEILEDLRGGRLSPGHGKALLSLERPEQRAALRQEILKTGLSVRQAEARAAELQAARAADVPLAPVPVTPLQARLKSLSDELTRAISARVEVRGSAAKGKITIRYSRAEELDRLIGQLTRRA